MAGKEFQGHQSNLLLNIPISTQPHSEMPRLLLSQTIPGMGTPPQPVPVLNHSFSEEFFPDIQLEPPPGCFPEESGKSLLLHQQICETKAPLQEKKCFPGICSRMPEARTRSHWSRTFVGTCSCREPGKDEERAEREEHPEDFTQVTHEETFYFGD